MQEIAHLKHWVLPGILINSVTSDDTKTNDEIAELLVWLASPANQTHTGEILSTNALAELRLTK